MTAGPNDLTTVVNALAWLGQADDGNGNLGLQRAITALSTQIQKWLGYNVLTATYTRTLDGSGSRMQFVPDRPVTAVSALSIEGQTIQASPDSLSPGFTFMENAIIVRSYQFVRGLQNIVATYTAGYATVPMDIEQACLSWLSILSSQQEDGGGGMVESKTAGGTMLKYVDWSKILASAGGLAIPPTVSAILQPYRRMWGA